MRHENKTALVTGAASGIGRGIAERLAADGAYVIVVDLKQAEAHEVAASIGGEAAVFDVSDENAVEAVFSGVVTRRGGLDIMVNNAGIMDIGPVADKTYADWQRVMRINVDGVFLGSRAAAKIMQKQRSGVIINASSGAGRKGSANLSSYCASKAAIISLTQTLAIELAPYGVRANSYTPGHIETPFWEDIARGFGDVLGMTHEEVIDRFKSSVPMGRFGTPADVAATVSWLASDEASYISGQAIGMNGAQLPW